MPAQPCTNHPNESTLVRCGRCDKPFCLRCMVDTPVGKKCRACAVNRTHLSESTPGGVLAGFGAAFLTALIGGWIIGQMPLLLLAAPYGYVIGEAALRAGNRSRSLAMQIATGAASLSGGLLATGYRAIEESALLAWQPPGPYVLAMVLLGTMIAVARVRYL